MTVSIPVKDSNLRISVVLPTIPSRPLDSLPHLERQRDIEYEVIVVNDDQLDICEARNAGVRAASTDYIALTDDDSEPPPDWLSTAYESISEPGIKLVEGSILEWQEPPRIYHGVNLVFTRDAWSAVSGFDSRYAGWMGDCVFGWKIEDTFGLDATRYVKELVMSHPNPKQAKPIAEIERLARQEYPGRYFELMRRPASFKGKLLITAASRTYSFAPQLWDRVL